MEKIMIAIKDNLFYNELDGTPWNNNGEIKTTTKSYLIVNKKKWHRTVWEHFNGEIPEGYVVHHIDHNKLNNLISNLQLLSINEHNFLHSKAKRLSEVTKQKLRDASLGRKHSDESKKKISDASKGNKHNLGKTLSEEHKKKIGESNKGNPLRLGKKQSEEHKKKISDARKNYWKIKKGLKNPIE